MNKIKANARLIRKQDVDLFFENLKSKVLGQPHDEVLITKDLQYKHYKAKEDRIFVKIAYCSETITEKLVALNITKLSSQSI